MSEWPQDLPDIVDTVDSVPSFIRRNEGILGPTLIQNPFKKGSSEPVHTYSHRMICRQACQFSIRVKLKPFLLIAQSANIERAFSRLYHVYHVKLLWYEYRYH